MRASLLKNTVKTCCGIFCLLIAVHAFEAIVLRMDETFFGENFINKLFGIFILWLTLRMLQWKWRDIGFTGDAIGRGIARGFALAAAVFAVAYAIEIILLKAQGNTVRVGFFTMGFSLTGEAEIRRGVGFILMCIFFNIVNVIMEEGTFRGLFYEIIRADHAAKAAVLIQALLFGIWHVVTPLHNLIDGDIDLVGFVGLSVGYILLAGIMGIKWSLMYRMTGNLYAGMSDHFFNNCIATNILHLYDKIDHHEKTMLLGELSAGVFVNAASVIMRLGVATTILTGTGLILSGQIDFMLLFMFLLVITRIYAPFDQALALIAEMFMSQVSASRLTEINDAKTAEGADSFAPNGHDIVFENVGFAYDDNQVLHGVSFTAKEGEVTALVGPSGSGKSTCSRLAARLWDVTEGVIRVGGVDIRTVDPEVLLTDYSMVFQDVVLFDDTVMENIRLGKHGASDEEVLAAAKAANCDEFVEKLPHGYATPIGENGAKLSGGERQRISIARALLKNAPIVLLDEATASLDVENETKVQGALSCLLQGKTVLVIAHRMRTVEAADKIIVLADGKVAEQGTFRELMIQNGQFAQMVRLQTESQTWSIA